MTTKRRDILAVLSGVALAGGLVGTETIAAKAVAGTEYDWSKAHPHVPQLDRNGWRRQHALADALEKLAAELRLSGDAQKAREERIAPQTQDEIWAGTIETHSKLNGEWLEHQIVINVELHHAVQDAPPHYNSRENGIRRKDA